MKLKSDHRGNSELFVNRMSRITARSGKVDIGRGDQWPSSIKSSTGVLQDSRVQFDRGHPKANDKGVYWKYHSVFSRGMIRGEAGVEETLRLFPHPTSLIRVIQ